MNGGPCDDVGVVRRLVIVIEEVVQQVAGINSSVSSSARGDWG